MAELHVGHGWTRAELAARLARLPALPPSAPPVPLEAMRAEDGWRSERSEAPIAREPPGPPRTGGAFARAREAVAAYAFSDPMIVEAHFDPCAPLRGRRMLLELKVLGLHYLCGVAVTDVRDESGGARSVFGFRYDTLAGHIERGAEWFLVEQDHATGIVRFVIEARWRRGELSTPWTRVGFSALAPAYRALWIRRAQERLRGLLAQPRAAGRPARTLAASTALGALTGVRGGAGLVVLAARAFVAGPPPGAGPVERAFARPAAMPLLAGLELGEMALDKTDVVPARVAPVPLALRAAVGAACGAVQARRRRRPAALAAVLAGAAAVASTLAAYHLREGLAARLGVPTAVLGAIEDVLVVLAGRKLIHAT
jgi:uncharacterized protein (UPF0548 family)/uncharacterized membrane protein